MATAAAAVEAAEEEEEEGKETVCLYLRVAAEVGSIIIFERRTRDFFVRVYPSVYLHFLLLSFTLETALFLSVSSSFCSFLVSTYGLLDSRQT